MWAQEYPKLSLHRLFTENEIQSFLQRFHFQRIAVRLLIAHCVALYNPLPFDNMIGVFSIKTPIQKIIYEAVDMAYEICNNTYGMAPLVIVKPAAAEQDVFFIPSHLQHIIFELVKNAMRAVIEAHEQRNSIKSSNLENSTGEGRLKPILISWRYDSEVIINLM